MGVGTSLFIAAQKGHLEIVKMLLANGAEVIIFFYYFVFFYISHI
jgi:ankyrin repeat protein